MTEPVRDRCCDGCPFRGRLDLSEAALALEDYPAHDPSCGVLCHADGFENDRPYALCAGFRANAVRLGLVGEG